VAIRNAQLRAVNLGLIGLDCRFVLSNDRFLRRDLLFWNGILR
jgi:hypothetical protein